MAATAEIETTQPRANLSAQHGQWRGLLLVLAAGWLARAVFMVVVPARAHSADVDSWITVAQQLRAGANPYVTTTFLNWPPLWLVVVWLLDHLSRTFDISFFLTLRLFLIAVESVLIVVLYSFLARVVPTQARRIVLAGISLNPVAILLVCQHGNFDVLVGLACLVGALALAGFARTHDVVLWLSGALAFGLGALAKTVPLALAPLLARGARVNTTPARSVALAVFVGPALLGTSIIYVLAPHAVLHNVLLYRSSAGAYGLTGIADAVGAGQLTTAYSRVLFPVLLLTGVLAGAVALGRRNLEGRRIVLLAALILFALPVLGPGYAPQYAYWSLPLLVATYPLFDRGWRSLLLAFGAIAAVDYIVEYGFLVDHGQFLLFLFPSSDFVVDARRFETDTWLTVLRLPLFLASVAVITGGLVRLARVEDDGWAARPAQAATIVTAAPSE